MLSLSYQRYSYFQEGISNIRFERIKLSESKQKFSNVNLTLIGNIIPHSNVLFRDDVTLYDCENWWNISLPGNSVKEFCISSDLKASINSKFDELNELELFCREWIKFAPFTNSVSHIQEWIQVNHFDYEGFVCLKPLDYSIMNSLSEHFNNLKYDKECQIFYGKESKNVNQLQLQGSIDSGFGDSLKDYLLVSSSSDICSLSRNSLRYSENLTKSYEVLLLEDLESSPFYFFCYNPVHYSSSRIVFPYDMIFNKEAKLIPISTPSPNKWMDGNTEQLSRLNPPFLSEYASPTVTSTVFSVNDTLDIDDQQGLEVLKILNDFTPIQPGLGDRDKRSMCLYGVDTPLDADIFNNLPDRTHIAGNRHDKWVDYGFSSSHQGVGFGRRYSGVVVVPVLANISSTTPSLRSLTSPPHTILEGHSSILHSAGVRKQYFATSILCRLLNDCSDLQYIPVNSAATEQHSHQISHTAPPTLSSHSCLTFLGELCKGLTRGVQFQPLVERLGRPERQCQARLTFDVLMSSSSWEDDYRVDDKHIQTACSTYFEYSPKLFSFSGYHRLLTGMTVQLARRGDDPSPLARNPRSAQVLHGDSLGSTVGLRDIGADAEATLTATVIRNIDGSIPGAPVLGVSPKSTTRKDAPDITISKTPHTQESADSAVLGSASRRLEKDFHQPSQLCSHKPSASVAEVNSREASTPYHAKRVLEASDATSVKDRKATEDSTAAATTNGCAIVNRETSVLPESKRRKDETEQSANYPLSLSAAASPYSNVWGGSGSELTGEVSLSGMVAQYLAVRSRPSALPPSSTSTVSSSVPLYSNPAQQTHSTATSTTFIPYQSMVSEEAVDGRLRRSEVMSGSVSLSTTSTTHILVSELLLEENPGLIRAIGQANTCYNILCVDCPIQPPVDVIIDINTAICFIRKRHFSERQVLKSYIKALTLHSYKFKTLWLIVLEDDFGRPAEDDIDISSTKQQLGSHNFSKTGERNYISQSTANTNLGKVEGMEVFVLLCQSLSEFPNEVLLRQVPVTKISFLISQILKSCSEDTCMKHDTLVVDYLRRPYLARLSEDLHFLALCEFLQLFPTVNFFMAAQLLSRWSIRELACCSVDEMRNFLKYCEESHVRGLHDLLRTPVGIIPTTQASRAIDHRHVHEPLSDPHPVSFNFRSQTVPLQQASYPQMLTSATVMRNNSPSSTRTASGKLLHSPGTQRSSENIRRVSNDSEKAEITREVTFQAHLPAGVAYSGMFNGEHHFHPRAHPDSESLRSDFASHSNHFHRDSTNRFFDSNPLEKHPIAPRSEAVEFTRKPSSVANAETRSTYGYGGGLGPTSSQASRSSLPNRALPERTRPHGLPDDSARLSFSSIGREDEQTVLSWSKRRL